MVTRALAKNWKRLFLLRRPRRKIPIHLSLLQTKTTSASIFEQLPQEELVAKSKSRLRDRQFLPGSTGGGFPEFLADPRDSFPFGVRVKNSNKSSLAELTAKCMEYVEENLPLSPAILFRGLPAKTAEDFSIIAHSIPGKTLAYEGGVATRRQVDKNAGTWTASDDPAIHTIEMHNELSYNAVFPYKVRLPVNNIQGPKNNWERKNYLCYDMCKPKLKLKFIETLSLVCHLNETTRTQKKKHIA